MAKVHDFLEMWQGSQNLYATQQESRAQLKQITAVGYFSDTAEIVRASWSLFQHDSAVAFTLLGRSPWPPPLSAKDLPEGRTQILNDRRIWWINWHPVESADDSPPESISATGGWLNWNGDLDNPNNSEDDCAADCESDIEHIKGIEDPECLEQWDSSCAPNVPGLIRPTRKSRRQAEKVFMTIKAIEMRRNMWVKQKLDRMRQCFTSFFMYLDRDCLLEIYYGRMASSSLWILVDKQMYSRRNEPCDKIHKFQSCESEQSKNVTALGFATGPNLNLCESLPWSSNHDENYYRWQQMLNGQYITMSVNGASMICGYVSTVITQWFCCCYA